MIQKNMVSFLGGALVAAFALTVTSFYGSFDIDASDQQASLNPLAVTPKPVELVAPEVLSFLTLYEYVPFPESSLVLRVGDTVVESPQARYTDKDYVDIDLERKVVTLFSQGKPEVMYEVMAYGNPWTSPTPKGEFSIKTKEEKHFSRKVALWMPWAMQVKGDYFLHGWPYYPDGILYKGKYSRGCIRIHTDQMKDLFGRIAIGTPVIIY